MEGKEREGGRQIFEEIMNENIPNLSEHINTRILQNVCGKFAYRSIPFFPRGTLLWVFRFKMLSDLLAK